MLIRKYPALFHYIIHLDLENDLNEITKVTNHQHLALLINIIDNRANHSFQLRQDLYNLLKGITYFQRTFKCGCLSSKNFGTIIVLVFEATKFSTNNVFPRWRWFG